jgi:hypothetical protein
MKKAIILIIEEVDLHLSNKMELLIESEIDKKLQATISKFDFRNCQQADTKKETEE